MNGYSISEYLNTSSRQGSEQQRFLIPLFIPPYFVKMTEILTNWVSIVWTTELKKKILPNNFTAYEN